MDCGWGRGRSLWTPDAVGGEGEESILWAGKEEELIIN